MEADMTHEPDDDERREAIDQRRARRRGRTVYRTYDDWKLASPDDDEQQSDRWKRVCPILKPPPDDDMPQPPYPWCRQPDVCIGLGYCPRDPNCGE
jgi:hypothetical protein